MVDTNLFVYAAERSFPEHEKCRSLVEQWRQRRAPWATTWHVVYELLRILTHPRVFRSPRTPAEAWTFVEAVLCSPGLHLLAETEGHAEVVAKTVAEVPGLAGNLFHDARTAIIMREHGIRRIYTRDTDFHRFPFIEVVDPLTARV